MITVGLWESWPVLRNILALFLLHPSFISQELADRSFPAAIVRAEHASGRGGGLAVEWIVDVLDQQLVLCL